MKNRLYIASLFFASVIIGSIACSSKDKSIPEHPNESEGKVTKTIKFAESKENIPNPERGFYVYRDFITGQTSVLTAKDVKKLREDQSITLIYTIYYMPDFRDKLISADYLQRIKTNMQALRDGGGKAVLRFSYTKSESDKPWDAPWEITQKHIEQLTPIFQEYADVISVLQAGFIGVWGEWYYTDNYFSSLKTTNMSPVNRC